MANNQTVSVRRRARHESAAAAAAARHCRWRSPPASPSCCGGEGPNWSLLYGNLSDADAGSVVQALQTAGIEYKLDNGSGAIMVPAERVHDARLQLASQGLPQGKSGGFELISKDPGFGVEPVHGERALSVRARERAGAAPSHRCRRCEAARVHLAHAAAVGVRAAIGVRPAPRCCCSCAPDTGSSPSRCRRSCTWWPRAFRSSIPTR